MTLVSKTAGGLSLISCIHDIHKTAVINSNNKYAQISGDLMIKSSVGNQKINKLSYKDAQRKNWLANSNFLHQTQELSARITGYISGFVKASVRYIPNFALSAVAILVGKHPKIANSAAIGLGLVELWDFIKNSTNIAQRTDYLE